MLKGHSFRGQDLSSANFSNADIRGAIFFDSTLLDANFTGIKTGLQPGRQFCLKMGLILLAALLSYVAAYAGTFMGLGFGASEIEESLVGRIVASLFGLGLSAFFVLIVIRRGIGAALPSFAIPAFAITVVITLTIFAAFPGVHGTVALMIFFAVSSAIEVAVMVAGAIAVAIARLLADKKVWLAMIVLAPLAAIPAIAEATLTVEFENVWRIWLAVGSAIPTVLILIGLSLYIGTQAVAGNPKYALVYKFALAVSSFGGTSFRNANLTNADFTQASLKQADFRGANLTRTRWADVKHLTHARTDDTYLEHAKIRQLVVTGSGQDQTFDHLDLRGLNLQGANLADTNLIGAKLSEANLRGANLDRAKLVQTQLYGSDLSGASLTGAYIQDWSISTDTNFDGVQCDYVYMQLPTKTDPDPCRKPDDRSEIFQPGDFTDFIAPIIKTLNLYQTQNVDLRMVAQQFKTLDLFHHEGIDPAAAAIALKQIAETYPEADLEVVALEGRGEDKVRVQAKVKGSVDRSALSADYFAAYKEMSAMPYAELQSLLAGIAEKDERIRSLEKMVTTAIESNKFYVETYYSLGDTVSEKSSININSGGGNVSGVVGGNIENVSGAVNLGAISGDVTNTIGQLPEAMDANEPSLKALLTKLQAAIEATPELDPEDKAEALEQVKTLAEAGQDPEDGRLKKSAKTAIKVLKGTAASLPDVTTFVQECTKLLPAIGALLVLL